MCAPKMMTARSFSFSYAGPRKLDDVIKTELLTNKTGSEIADIWYSYHEGKENVVGLVMKGAEGKLVLRRAAKHPFIVQPVFRDDGFFMLLSNFQSPSHFLLAYLEDYKMDPHSATPLITFSVFDDLADDKDIALVRCDVLNKSIEDDEARKVVEGVIDNYRNQEDYGAVKTFNEKPAAFDIDDYISRMNHRWKVGGPNE